jgi:hypothetical protein
MVDGSHEVGAVLGAVHIEVPVALQQLRLAVSQVGTQDSSQSALSNSLVELLQAAGEQREGGVGNDALGAALREGAEEIGWKKDTMTLVGALDYVITPSRARIYPFVVTVADWEEMRLSEGEVAEVFTVPVRFFMENEPNECEMELATRAGRGFPLDKIPFASETYRTKRAYRVRWYEYDGRVIWGLTANILLAFMRAVKEGRIELPE